MARLTVKDLLDQRGKHQFAMLRVETLDEAEAAAAKDKEAKAARGSGPAKGAAGDR